MSQILKKSLIKWSTLAVLGVSAYFVGYFWGVRNMGDEASSRRMASESKPETPESNQAADFGKLK